MIITQTELKNEIVNEMKHERKTSRHNKTSIRKKKKNAIPTSHDDRSHDFIKESIGGQILAALQKRGIKMTRTQMIRM